jgi:hypothetical protein
LIMGYPPIREAGVAGVLLRRGDVLLAATFEEDDGEPTASLRPVCPVFGSSEQIPLTFRTILLAAAVSCGGTPDQLTTGSLATPRPDQTCEAQV